MKNETSFADWIVDHVVNDKKSKRFKRICGKKHQYKLWEKKLNVDMSIVVTGLPSNSTIIDPASVGQWNWFEDLKDWSKRCDFLIVGKSGEIPFAFLIELKKSAGPNNKLDAQKQLQWSRSLLHFALSTYSISEVVPIHESDLVVKYLMVAQDPSDRFPKLPTTPHKTSHFYSDIHKGITVNYSLSDKFTLKELLSLD